MCMFKHVSVYKNLLFIYIVDFYLYVEVFCLLSLHQLNGGSWNEAQLVLQIEELEKIG